MPYTNVTVTVPEDKVAEVLRYAASLVDGTAEPEEPDDGGLLNGGRRRWGWGRRTVQDAYMGGVSDVWRPFLDYLSDRPDEWVSWTELCEHIQRTPQEASGMLGAAERRCHGRPPYEKKWVGQVRHFRMPESVAEVIVHLRDDEDQE